MGSQPSATHRPPAMGALVRFGLLALVPVIALGAVLGHLLNTDVQQRYLESSRSSASLITQIGIQPLLNAQEMLNGLSPAEVAQVDEKLRGAAVSQQVQRIKVWNRSGTIVYSDNPALIGKTFPVDDDLGGAFAGHSTANVTDGQGAENAGDTLVGPLVQVYVPLVFSGGSSPSGAFELYLPYSPVQAAVDRESGQLYVFLAAGLTLFYASMFPVVVLADRWRRRLMREAEITALANLAMLERLNKLKSEFLVRISHQFRTALVGIEGFSEFIRDSEHLDLGEVKSFASDIYKDAERLDRAFSEMVELDRMEAGRATLKLARIDINRLIVEVVGAARDRNSHHTLAADLDPEVPSVSGDRDRLSQVLTILLGNALKYSPAGSEVAVSSKADPDEVTVTVKDHGPGMPANFDDSHSNGDQRPADGGGDAAGRGRDTGLGLPVARQIVEMHRGRLWFESTIGVGSEFHFSLPLKDRSDVELNEPVAMTA
jgi:signal transduction histidine kinase